MSLHKQGVLRRSSIDPRTVLLSVLVINAVALSHGHLPTLLISIAFSSIALATVKPHYGLICLCAFALSYLGYWGLLQLPGSTFFAFSAAIFSWLSRFVISMSIGAFGLLTLTPSTLTSALRDLRLPGWATIPPAVFLRVLPIIVAEAKAIRDAMVLRGLQPGVKSWFTQPTQSSAMLIIPLLGAVVRAGDELAASALVRGLGGPTSPTTTADLSFKLVDATAIAGLGLVVASVWLPTEVHL